MQNLLSRKKMEIYLNEEGFRRDLFKVKELFFVCLGAFCKYRVYNGPQFFTEQNRPV